jgi:hypothetical protein
LPLGVRLQMLSVLTDGATLARPFLAKETPKAVRRMDNPTFVRYHRAWHAVTWSPGMIAKPSAVVRGWNPAQETLGSGCCDGGQGEDKQTRCKISSGIEGRAFFVRALKPLTFLHSLKNLQFPVRSRKR